MADESIGDQSGQAPKPSSRKITIIVVALLMLGEGVGIFLVTRAMQRSPDQAAAADSDGAGSEEASVEELAEVDLAECRPTNRITGKLVSYQLRVSALVASEGREEVEEIIKAKKERILDRINFVIRSAEPRQLGEPGLETIKRRIKAELDELLDDDQLIRAVLIPEFLQS